MKLPKKHLILLLAAALLCGALAGCGIMGPNMPSDPYGVGGQEPETSATIDMGIPCDGRISISFVPEDALNPYTSTARDNLNVGGLIYEGLYALGENFTAAPVLAEGLATLDGRRYTLEIQSGITFHSGEPMTIEDVIYSLGRARNSAFYGGRLSIVDGYERRLDAEGETLSYEMDIILNRVHGNIPVLLTFPIIQRGTFYQPVPPGTGPYRFLDEAGMPRLVGYAGHRYYQDLPIDTIYLREIATMEQLTANFNSGYLDIAALELTVAEPLLAQTRELRHFEASLMDYVGFNLRRPETGRAEVRQAISYAINRTYITENIMRGNAVASPLPIHPVLFYYDHALSAEFSFDIDLARQLLAGEVTLDRPHPPPPNGEEADATEDEPPDVPPSEDADDDEDEGENEAPPVQLTLLVADGNTNRMEVAVYIAASIAELGYQVIIDDRPYHEFIQALADGDFDLFYGQVRLQSDFDLSELLFGALAFGGSASIDSRLLDDFLASAQSDRGQRASAVSWAILREAPIAVIGFRHLSVATQRGVVVGMQPTQENLYHNVWEWMINLPSLQGADED